MGGGGRLPRANFKYVVELALLKATRSRFLTSVLQPYEAQLAILGVPIRAAGDRTSWLLQLHRVLNCDDEATPAALQSAMIQIGDLATELGHEMIVTQALERDVHLFARHKTLSRQDLAFYVYQSHPTVFRAAHARLQPQRAPYFVEFYGDGSATFSKKAVDRELERARDRLSSHFQTKNRTQFCRVWTEQLGSEIAFVFVRGGAPNTIVSVHPPHDDLLTYVPEQHDVVLYHPETDRLSICTPYPTDQAHYRAMMGLVLALDNEYFRAIPVFHSEPLKERGSAALDIGDTPHLHRVCLRKVTLLGRDERESSLQFASEDLGTLLDRGPLRTVLQQRPIGAWTFGVFLRQNVPPGEVDVLPPNQLRFDRRVPLGPFRSFMAKQGFLRLPRRR
jgi:hypothetical protein